MLFSRSLMLIGTLALRKTTEEKTRILLLLHIPIRFECMGFVRYIYTLHEHNTLMRRILKTIWMVI